MCETELAYDFATSRLPVVHFLDLELSLDANILLSRQAKEKVKIHHTLAGYLEEWLKLNSAEWVTAPLSLTPLP